MTLRLEGHVLANIHLSWIDPYKTRRLTVIGERRMLVFDDVVADEKLRLYDRGASYEASAEQARGAEYGEYKAIVRDGDILIPRVAPTEPLKEQTAHFLDCCEQRPRAGDERAAARRVVAVLEAASALARERRRGHRDPMARIFQNVALGEAPPSTRRRSSACRRAAPPTASCRPSSGPDAVIRSHAVVYAGTTIGARFNAGHGALVREDNVLGDDVSVGTNAALEFGNRIGDRVRIHTGCFLESCVVEDDVFLGPHVVFTDDPHPMCPRYRDCVGGATVRRQVEHRRERDRVARGRDRGGKR